MATTYYENIQKLYVAYFNRPADTAGLAYWETVVEAAKGDTTAVSAAFAAEAEYKTAYAGMSNADVVNKVYLNLFGRAAEDAGKAYWADLLDKKSITIDKVVTQIAAGAQGSDLTAYKNKVIGAQAFTAALDVKYEQDGYKGDAANAVAKSFMSGITTDASLTAAIAPANLGASVAKVVAAGTAFTLVSGLTALDAATTAKATFLAAADGDGDAKTSTTDAAITAKVGTAVTALDDVVAGDYTNSTAGVKAALLSSQVAINAATLADAQAAVATANANVAKVAGLSTAIATLDAATAAATAAGKADTAAATDLAAKVGSYNYLHSGATITVGADGTVAGLITVDAKGNLVLATGVTETTNAGITAVLNSSIALEAADKALADANTATAKAQASVDILDLTSAAVADLKAMASTMTQVKVEAGATPTVAQVQTELSSLDAIAKSTAAIANQTGKQADIDAANAAANAYNAFKTSYDKFIADDNANPLVKAVADAKASVTASQGTIDALAKAVAGLDTANALNAQLKAVNGQLTAAQDAFTSHGLSLPYSLVGTDTVATAGADIYVAGTVDTKIINFGLLGSDSLFIGSQYTLNTGKLSTGNNAVLEAFIQSANNGADTVIQLEKSVFGSNAATAEVVTITLTGVTSDHVHLSNGIITVS